MSADTVPPRAARDTPLPRRVLAFVRAAWRQWVAVRRSLRAAARLDRTAVGRTALRRATSDPRRILVAGDSLALDWGATPAGTGIVGCLQRDWPTATIDRVGRGSARMRDVARQLHAAQAALGSGPRYDVVLVIAGGNDALRWGGHGRLARDAARIADLLPTVGRHALWLGPANASLSPLFVAPFDRWIGKRLQTVVTAIGEVARRRGVPFVDYFAARDDDVFSKDPRRYYAADLLHPSGEAYALCYATMRAAVPLDRWLATPRSGPASDRPRFDEEQSR